MPQQYTLDQVDAEIARRARSQLGGAVPANGLVPAEQPASSPRAFGLSALSEPTQVTPAGTASTQAAAPENPRTGSFWQNIGTAAKTGYVQGLNDETAAVNKLLGAKATESTKQTFLDPLEQRSEAAQSEYRNIRGRLGTWSPEGIAYDVTNSVGQVAGSLPVDLGLGRVAKGVVALSEPIVKYAPVAADSIQSMFKAIPNFALGAGIRKTGEKESITGLPQGIAEGLAMEKTGEIGKNMSFVPRLATQVAAQGALGAGMTTAETLASEGRLPTGEELAQSATTNAAMALPFSGMPERMGVKRDLSPAMRKEFETRIGDIVKKDQLSALPDETLAQLRDTAGKISEYDPENKNILQGLLEIDQEQKRRSGVEPQGATLAPPEETPPAEQRPYSRAELAGLASGDLNAQDRLMEIADAYGIKEPHKMEPADLVDTIDKAEADRQTEVQRQADIAAQAEQARKDILAAQDEAGRLEAIQRFEDATKAIREVPALPIGTQDFSLVGEPTPKTMTSAQREQAARAAMQPEPDLSGMPQSETAQPPQAAEPQRPAAPEPFARENEEAFGPVEEQPNAGAIRSDTGQIQEPRPVYGRSLIEGGGDLQHPASEGAGRPEPGQRPGDQGTPVEARAQVETPEQFARSAGIPETPEFLDAIKQYQEITGTAPEAQPAPAETPQPQTQPAPVQPEAVAPPVQAEAAPIQQSPTLTTPLGADGKPLFEQVAVAPFMSGGTADVSRGIKQPDMVPLSQGQTQPDMGPQAPQAQTVQASAPATAEGLPLRLELPEMVRLTRDLIAKTPAIKERLSTAEARGLFRAKEGNPGMELRSDIFIGPQLAEVRTKAPAPQARAALVDSLAQAHGIPTNEIQVRAVPDKSGWTRLRAYRSDPELAGQVMAHEIGHLVDFMPDQTLARGNILGRLGSLKKNIDTMIRDMPAGVDGQAEAGNAPGFVTQAEITRELKGLTQWWKPFDPKADPEYTRYRHSSPELYADAFSVLLNAPGELKARAPRFYDAFQNYLIQKPEVRDAYQGIQDAMHSGQVMRDRVMATREGFQKADEARAVMYGDERTLKERVGETGRWAKRAFVDQYAPVRQVLTNEDASYAINRAIYSGSEKELYVTEMQHRVSQRLQDAGLTPDDLGEYLLHMRVVNERGQMANPHGWTPKTSLERLDEMRTSTYTPDQLTALEGAEKDFRDIRANLVTDKMEQSGMFAPELMQHIREATDYATFDVVKYIDDSFGPGIGAKIHKQIGTMEAVGSPYTATLKKDLSMLSSINWNTAKKAVVDDLLTNKPDQIVPAEMRYNGQFMAPVERMTDKVGTLYMMREGKLEAYYVDRLVAEAFNRDRPEDLRVAGKILSSMASPFRTIFTSIRPGFQAFNAIRDLRALYRNLPGDLTAGKTIQNYLRALPEAWAAEFGFTPEIVKEMQRDNMLISVADPMGLARIDKEHDRLMKMYNLEPGKYQNTVWKPFMNLYGQALKLGGFLERIPKIAGYRYLKENFPEMSKDQIGEFVRTKAGSPAFLYKGSLSPITNNLFLFSNAIVQGMRGDFGAMKADPKNWWSKWAIGTIAPKMVGRLALYGAFGAGVKTIMDGISDYDLSNYDVIPLGLDANGKSVYLRLPVDEMGRMTGSLLWKGLNLVDGAGPTKPADIFDMMAGQAPNVAPWATLLGGAVSFLGGHNPYDAFRGREIIDPTAFKAGGWEAQKQMLEWMWNTAGLGIVYRFDGREVDPVKTDLQKAVGLPVVNDFLGRFLRVSDQGIREKLRAAGDVESSKRAQQVLDARSALAKLINGETLTDTDNVALARESKALKQGYGRLLTKQQDEALASALQNAGSQMENAAIYQEWDRIKGTRQ